MKLVVDSNIAISGLLHPDRNAGLLLNAWRAGHFTWCSADEQLEELANVLSRKYFFARFGGSEEIKNFLIEMHARCSLHTLPFPLPNVCRDVKDDWLFSLSDVASADLIVSGDQDLLALKGQYRVVTVAEFLRRL